MNESELIRFVVVALVLGATITGMVGFIFWLALQTAEAHDDNK